MSDIWKRKALAREGDPAWHAWNPNLVNSNASSAMTPTPQPRTADCIETPWPRNEDGYGFRVIRGVKWRAHRWAWTLAFGPIPDGKHVLHACDNPPCINPVHLRIGTNADNIRDRMERGRTTATPGERNGKARLTDAQVRELRTLNGLMTAAMAGRRFDVAESTVFDIWRGRTRRGA